MNSIIVYGPPGCGKTTNKDKLARHFNKTLIIDDWIPGDNIPDNALILTNTPGIAGALLFYNLINYIGLCNMDKFKEELCKLINAHCVEELADMPDYLLAEMLCGIIHTVGESVKRTLDWHGVDSVCHPRQR